MMKSLNLICFTICAICIVVATVMTFMMIWGAADEHLWKTLLSTLVLFLACSLMLGVIRIVERNRYGES